MESEASSRSSESPTLHQLSTTNASTDDKRSGGRKRRRQPLNVGVGVRRRKRSEMASSHAAAEWREKVNVLLESGGGREVEFVDEEAIFNMPLLTDCMAEGMLLTPPALKRGFYWTHDVDDDLHFPLFHP